MMMNMTGLVIMMMTDVIWLGGYKSEGLLACLVDGRIKISK